MEVNITEAAGITKVMKVTNKRNKYVLEKFQKRIFFLNKHLGKTRFSTEYFLRWQLSYFSLGHIRLHRYDSFIRFILLLLGDMNVNPGQITVNNNSINSNIPQFHNCHQPTMPSERNSSHFYKAHDNSKLKIFKNNACISYILVSTIYYLKATEFLL